MSMRPISEEQKTREEDDMKLAQQLHEESTGTTASDFSCSMCFEDFTAVKDLNKGVVTKCGHKFCMECFLKYVETREKQISDQVEKARNVAKIDKDIKCPLCRASIMVEANRIRRMNKIPAVYIPDHPAPSPKRMTWDPATSVIVVCNQCSQRLFAPPGKVVKCVCKNLIQPQAGNSLWRADNRVVTKSSLPPDQRQVTLVICPGCRRTFTASAGETIRCECGTGLYVPPNSQRPPNPNRQRRSRDRPTPSASAVPSAAPAASR
eukprot:TRINITY_DN4129_c0_g1_i1.p1 TRINITY_DN4129_c0_g1~~TRINITY_DN4129_c0_g1_i1.p1  ORF type:complete len:292 (+),score=52.82 TRINITY_DN4129_c0_g1_i1:86-877(+)